MSWDRFHYLCRRYSRMEQPREAFDQCIDALERSPGTELYGGANAKESMAGQLLRRIGQLERPEHQREVAAFYGQLDFTASMARPPHTRRASAYLSLLGMVFVFIAALFQLKVLPQLLGVLDDFRLDAPGLILLFIDHGSVFFAAVLLLLMFSLVTSLEVRGLFQLQPDQATGWLFRLLIPIKIREQHQLLLELLSYPLMRAAAHNQVLDEHLGSLPESEQPEELQILLRRHSQRLARLSEFYLRGVIAVVALTLVAAILLFLLSAYAPLFMLGDLL